MPLVNRTLPSRGRREGSALSARLSACDYCWLLLLDMKRSKIWKEARYSSKKGSSYLLLATESLMLALNTLNKIYFRVVVARGTMKITSLTSEHSSHARTTYFAFVTFHDPLVLSSMVSLEPRTPA